MPAVQIRNIYRGLIRIEHTFEITKSDIEVRPVFVWTTEHIKAHFSTCYTSLTMLKILMAKMNYQYSADRILTSLRNCTASDLDNTYWQFNYYDEILEQASGFFGLVLNYRRRTRDQIRRLLKY